LFFGWNCTRRDRTGEPVSLEALNDLSEAQRHRLFEFETDLGVFG